MRKLRLLLLSSCNRTCEGCCNQQWDLESLPVCTDYSGYDEVMITGGEPMLSPPRILAAVRRIIREHKGRTILYTAKVDRVMEALIVLAAVEGMTVTLHEQSDVTPWMTFRDEIRRVFQEAPKSLRLNVFAGIVLPEDVAGWVVKENIEWIKDCPLPDGEEFMRYE